MQSIENLITRVNKTLDVAKSKLPVPESLATIEQNASLLVERLQADKYVKVPFVGDFNSGKSSLLNTYIDRDLLPTNIRPETAIAYELYFAENERLEHVANESTTTHPLSAIKELKVKPGDIARVYINNANIKKMNEKGIVLVDMPGIDSGIEAHNNAILHYIKEGTMFMLFSDVEQGTLSASVISFLNELKTYGLATHLFLSKADKKPKADVDAVRADVERIVRNVLSADTTVGVSSAVEPEYGFKDVEATLMNFDAQSVIMNRFQAEVDNFVAGVVSQFEMQIKFVLSGKKDFSGTLAELTEKKAQAINALKEKSANAQPVSDSAEDILQDVREALFANSARLAATAFSSQGNAELVGAEIISIVRPVLVNSFKRELQEYQSAIGECLKEFSADISKLINGVNAGGDLLENVDIEKVLMALIELISKRFPILRILMTVLGPIADAIRELFKWLFGKSDQEVIDEIRQKVESEVIEKIVCSLRPNVLEMLTQIRNEAYDEAKATLESTVKSIDDNIAAVQQQQLDDEKMVSARVNELTEALNSIRA